MILSEVKIVVEGGVVLTGFESYAINTDLVTPCSGWDVTIGGLRAWRKYSGVVVPDAKVQIFIDSVQVMQGWIDVVESECTAEAMTVRISGRDHLKPLVKCNVHPNTVIKDLTIAQAVEKVLTQVYRTEVPTVFFDNEANRKVLTRKTSKKGKPINAQKQLEQLQPQSGEGAFEFVARFLRRNGLWLWPTVDGNLVVGKPNYDQPPHYNLTRSFGGTVSTVQRAKVRRDKTNVASHVYIFGKSGGKGEKSTSILGHAVDADWKLWAPMYVKHDEVTTAKEADNIAWQQLTRQKQNEFVYECTVKGHFDAATRAYYAIDTIAHVHDEIESLDSDMYVSSCTWEQSASETTTRLKLIPLYSLIFEEEDKQ